MPKVDKQNKSRQVVQSEGRKESLVVISGLLEGTMLVMLTLKHLLQIQ